MKVLVICDALDTSQLGRKVKEELKKYLEKDKHSVATFEIQTEDMHHCIGCFGCWVKTPGECVFKDISSDINKAYIGSDIAIFASPVRYGCYTPAIRRTLDRMIPNILPFFKKIKGEQHHAPRYKKYPGYIAFGYGEDITKEEAETFHSLCKANALNLQAKKAATYISRSESDVTDRLISLCNYLKECEQ